MQTNVPTMFSALSAPLSLAHYFFLLPIIAGIIFIASRAEKIFDNTEKAMGEVIEMQKEVGGFTQKIKDVAGEIKIDVLELKQILADASALQGTAEFEKKIEAALTIVANLEDMVSGFE